MRTVCHHSTMTTAQSSFADFIAAVVEEELARGRDGSGEAVKECIEDRARWTGSAVLVHAVDLSQMPPVVEVTITFEVSDELAYCEELQELFGKAVRVTPWVSPLGKTFGGPHRRPPGSRD